MNEPSDSNKINWRDRLRAWRGRIRGMLPFASGVLAALLALILYNFLFPANHITQNEMADAIALAMASATPRPAFSEDVYRIIQPSLVLIRVELKDGQKALGSGVIIDEAGDILTSLHVVDGASKIEVIFADGTHADGSVKSAQPANDIAVLQASVLPQLFVPATLGNPRALQVGDEAYVVGNPFGLDSSMSAGVISGFDRTFQPETSKIELKGLIQIDAAVNPGNSGGPLLNRNGQVVGIVTGLINPTKENFFIGIA
ncbi:MAG: trypsin-like peptidase domain-containing protein, partial [Chloroflexota bacterium]